MSFQSLTRSGLGRALAWSLVLHVLLLWPSTRGRQIEGSVAPLTAMLGPAPANRAANDHVVRKTKNSAALDLPDTRAERGSGSSTPATDSTAIGATRSDDGTSPAATNEFVSAEDLRGYRLALARAAGQHRRYPQQAIDNGWHGTVEIRVTVPPDGRPQLTLLGSSGIALLDSAAEEMLGLALPTMQLPESVRGRAFSVVLPIVFELPE